MSACTKQIFQGIPQSRFDHLRRKAWDNGIFINGNAGEISKDGITIGWFFDPLRQVLEVQCIDVPFFVSCNTVNSRISDLVNGT
jgi:hypothetical protein